MKKLLLSLFVLASAVCMGQVSVKKTQLTATDISNFTSGYTILDAPASGYVNRVISITLEVQSGTAWSNVVIYASADGPSAEFSLSGILNTGARTLGKMEKYDKGGDNISIVTPLVLLTFSNPSGGTKPMDVYVVYEKIAIQ